MGSNLRKDFRPAKFRDALQASLISCVQQLGNGFISHPDNCGLRQKIQEKGLTEEALFRQLLRTTYRLIVLFMIEDRGLLKGVPGYQCYERFFAMRRLRLLAQGLGNRVPDSALWQQIQKLFMHLGQGCSRLGLGSLSSAFWLPENIPDLACNAISNDSLLAALRSLLFVQIGRNRTEVDFALLQMSDLGGVYESMLDLAPQIDVEHGTFKLVIPEGTERKGTGSYYTPPELVELLLERSLDTAIEEALQSAEPENALLSLKILDPTCGAGNFLLSATHHLARALCTLRGEEAETGSDSYRKSFGEIARTCIYGVDINEMAVEICRLNLWIESFASDLPVPLTFLDGHIKSGNSVIGATPFLLAQDNATTPVFKEVSASTCTEISHGFSKRTLADSRRQQADDWCASFFSELHGDLKFFHWHIEFPNVFTMPLSFKEADNPATGWSGGFDVVVGNPPYGNAIESNTARGEEEKRIYKVLYENTAVGAYDKVNLFLHQAVGNLLKPGGYYALLQPRSNLSSRAAIPLQESFNRDSPPQYILSPDNSHLFSPAIIFVAAVIGQKSRAIDFEMDGSKPELAPVGNQSQPPPECLVSTSSDLGALEFKGRTLTVPWWTMLFSAPQVLYSRLDDFQRFDTFANITAGCTASGAYELKPLIVDSQKSKGLKLVTTGLIDRYRTLWGIEKARFLKHDYDFPHWPCQSEELPAGVRNPLEVQAGPKVLVAGLVKRIESFFDFAGEFAGVVSTFVVKPSTDAINMRLIAVLLNSWLFSYEYLRLYGAKEIGGGGYWSIGKRELQSIPVPAALFTKEPTSSLLLDQLDEAGKPFDDNEFQQLLCRLVGLSKNDTNDLKRWYFGSSQGTIKQPELYIQK